MSLRIVLIAGGVAVLGLMPLACRPPVTPPATELPMHAQQVGRTHVYECGDAAAPYRVVTRNGPGEIALWLPPRFGRPYLVLGQTRAASGARYEGDGVIFWSKERQATLVIDEVSQGGCVENTRASIWEQAKLNGVDFRATGNEPPWILEIRHQDQIRLLYGYDRQEVTAPCPPPSQDRAERRTVYVADAGGEPLEVILSAGPCADTMDGEVYSTRVLVRWSGRTLTGCGKPLH